MENVDVTDGIRPQNRMLNFFELVPDNIRAEILEFHTPFECLTLRRVSRTFKFYIETNVGILKRKTQWDLLRIKIRENDESMGMKRFVKTNLKYISNFYFRNETTSIYRPEVNPSIHNFIQNHSCNIKRLLVENFYNFQFPHAERHFFESLTNLQNLEITYVTWGHKQKHFVGHLTPCFQTLKILKIYLCHRRSEKKDPNTGNVVVSRLDKFVPWLCRLMDHCPNLEMFSIPYCYPSDQHDLHRLVDHLIQWTNAEPQNGRKLNFIDVNDFRLDEQRFMNIFAMCAAKEIKLLNVPEHGFVPNVFTPRNLAHVVASGQLNTILDLDYLLNADLCNLENLNMIFHMRQQNAHPALNPEIYRFRREWPNLKSINLSVSVTESLYSFPAEHGVAVWTAETVFINLLLNTELWPTVTNLSVEIDYTGETDFWIPDSPSNLISSLTIINNFKNLTSFTISGWDAPNKEFVQFWDGLPSLEILTIRGCRNLSHVGFTGERKPPSFLQLKKLRKLTLNLSSLPALTHRLFQNVLRHMPLKELYLEGQHPKRRLVYGILALKHGTFASTIERFPFDAWSLRDVRRGHFMKIKKQFRSLC